MINKLIINADDFGMTLGNTLGILLAHKKGILTSTTCMVNMPYAQFALDEAKKYPELGVGIHLVLTVGKPLLEGGKSFTDQNGNFIRPKDYPDGKPHGDEDELYAEWKAQIEKFISMAGCLPTHIDSHHHVHLLPWHRNVVERLSKEYNLPVRQEEKVYNHIPYIPFTEDFYGRYVEMNFDLFKKVCNEHEGALELMCHPALIDQQLYDMSAYSLPRMKELDILTSNDAKDFITNNHIQLINFTQIK